MRWLTFTTPEAWESRLLTAKVRVAHLAGLSAPRFEMNGLVMGHRVANNYLRALKIKPFRVHFLTDSECAIPAIQLEHGCLHS